jgi:site-specific DNA-methyltransferase (adenine-specific)
MNHIDPKLINQILCTDCVAGMQQLPDCCIPLTVTSPPYDDLRTYGGHTFDFEAVAGELWRITMNGGIVVWVVGEQVKKGTETGTAARQKLHFMDLGFRCSTMIMVTSRVRFPQRGRYPSVFDYAFVLTKGRPRHFHAICDKKNKYVGEKFRWKLRERDGRIVKREHCHDKYVGVFGSRMNVWFYHVGYMKTTTDKDAYGHPALMPEKMAEDFIISFSRPGDLILDPFSGAGTTSKMAMLNGRRYLGMEICENYASDSRKRLEKARQEHKRRLDDLLFGGDQRTA